MSSTRVEKVVKSGSAESPAVSQVFPGSRNKTVYWRPANCILKMEKPSRSFATSTYKYVLKSDVFTKMIF